jgi:hypothetical protein
VTGFQTDRPVVTARIEPGTLRFRVPGDAVATILPSIEDIPDPVRLSSLFFKCTTQICQYSDNQLLI